MNLNLINDIQNAKYDTKSINQILEDLFVLFKPHISTIADKTIPKITSGDLSLSKQAFELRAKNILKYALSTYLDNERWAEGVKVYPYLLKSLSRFAENIISENEFKETNNSCIHVCPACKEYKMREILLIDGDGFICNNCSSKIQEIEKEIQNCKEQQNLEYLERKLFFIKTFSKHSKKGVRCPNCNKFVPESCYIGDYLFCPYPKCNADCSDAIKMKHPVFSAKNTHIDIDYKPPTTKGAITISNFYCSSTNNSLKILDDEESLNNSKSIIKNVIEMQKITQCNKRKIPTKYCMYDAFLNVLEKQPQDMVRYITVGGQVDGVFIQANIYQEFCNLLEQFLPIIFYEKGVQVRIDNPLDERIHLYDGINQFSNYIDQYGWIKKRISYKIDPLTEEKFPTTDDCFIAKIISITDQFGNDLTDLVYEYNFSSIRMKETENTKPGTVLTVKHYSIRPNYTLGSMIHLQRIKRKIKDSSIRKINILNNIKGENHD